MPIHIVQNRKIVELAFNNVNAHLYAPMATAICISQILSEINESVQRKRAQIRAEIDAQNELALELYCRESELFFKQYEHNDAVEAKFRKLDYLFDESQLLFVSDHEYTQFDHQVRILCDHLEDLCQNKKAIKNKERIQHCLEVTQFLMASISHPKKLYLLDLIQRLFAFLQQTDIKTAMSRFEIIHKISRAIKEQLIQADNSMTELKSTVQSMITCIPQPRSKLRDTLSAWLTEDSMLEINEEENFLKFYMSLHSELKRCLAEPIHYSAIISALINKLIRHSNRADFIHLKPFITFWVECLSAINDKKWRHGSEEAINLLLDLHIHLLGALRNNANIIDIDTESFQTSAADFYSTIAEKPFKNEKSKRVKAVLLRWQNEIIADMKFSHEQADVKVDQIETLIEVKRRGSKAAEEKIQALQKEDDALAMLSYEPNPPFSVLQLEKLAQFKADQFDFDEEIRQKIEELQKHVLEGLLECEASKEEIFTALAHESVNAKTVNEVERKLNTALNIELLEEKKPFIQSWISLLSISKKRIAKGDQHGLSDIFLTLAKIIGGTAQPKEGIIKINQLLSSIKSYSRMGAHRRSLRSALMKTRTLCVESQQEINASDLQLLFFGSFSPVTLSMNIPRLKNRMTAEDIGQLFGRHIDDIYRSLLVYFHRHSESALCQEESPELNATRLFIIKNLLPHDFESKTTSLSKPEIEELKILKKSCDISAFCLNLSTSLTLSKEDISDLLPSIKANLSYLVHAKSYQPNDIFDRGHAAYELIMWLDRYNHDLAISLTHTLLCEAAIVALNEDGDPTENLNHLINCSIFSFIEYDKNPTLAESFVQTILCSLPKSIDNIAEFTDSLFKALSIQNSVLPETLRQASNRLLNSERHDHFLAIYDQIDINLEEIDPEVLKSYPANFRLALLIKQLDRSLSLQKLIKLDQNDLDNALKLVLLNMTKQQRADQCIETFYNIQEYAAHLSIQLNQRVFHHAVHRAVISYIKLQFNETNTIDKNAFHAIYDDFKALDAQLPEFDSILDEAMTESKNSQYFLDAIRTMLGRQDAPASLQDSHFRSQIKSKLVSLFQSTYDDQDYQQAFLKQYLDKCYLHADIKERAYYSELYAAVGINVLSPKHREAQNIVEQLASSDLFPVAQRACLEDLQQQTAETLVESIKHFRQMLRTKFFEQGESEPKSTEEVRREVVATGYDCGLGHYLPAIGQIGRPQMFCKSSRKSYKLSRAGLIYALMQQALLQLEKRLETAAPIQEDELLSRFYQQLRHIVDENTKDATSSEFKEQVCAKISNIITEHEQQLLVCR